MQNPRKPIAQKVKNFCNNSLSGIGGKDIGQREQLEDCK